jgi:hypothetical protein
MTLDSSVSVTVGLNSKQDQNFANRTVKCTFLLHIPDGIKLNQLMLAQWVTQRLRVGSGVTLSHSLPPKSCESPSESESLTYSPAGGLPAGNSRHHLGSAGRVSPWPEHPPVYRYYFFRIRLTHCKIILGPTGRRPLSRR